MMKRTLGAIIVMGGLVVALGGYAANAVTKVPDSSAASVAAEASKWVNTTINTANAIAPNSPLVAPNSPLAAPSHGPGQFGRGAMGKVTSVDGSMITIQDQRQQNAITVTLTDSTKVFKQTAITLADAPVGESISAIGQQGSDVFTATQVLIGQATVVTGMAPGGPPQQGGDHPNNGQPPANGPQGNPLQGNGPQRGGPPGNRPQGNGPQPGHGGARLFGTIEQVSSDTITVKLTDNSTVQLKLATNGQVLQQVAGTSADITVGAQIRVMGEQNAAAVTATQIEILPTTVQ